MQAQRMRTIRFNDLIDPETIALDTDFAAIIESNVRIVVQFQRVDTSRNGQAILGTLAYSVGGL